MSRTTTFLPRWAALLLVALTWVGSVDLHFLADGETGGHGLLVQRSSETMAEDCGHGNEEHVEAVESERPEECALCHRTLHDRGMEASPELAGSVVPPEPSRFASLDLPRLRRLDAPTPVRGPPVS